MIERSSVCLSARHRSRCWKGTVYTRPYRPFVTDNKFLFSSSGKSFFSTTTSSTSGHEGRDSRADFHGSGVKLDVKSAGSQMIEFLRSPLPPFRSASRWHDLRDRVHHRRRRRRRHPRSLTSGNSDGHGFDLEGSVSFRQSGRRHAARVESGRRRRHGGVMGGKAEEVGVRNRRHFIGERHAGPRLRFDPAVLMVMVMVVEVSNGKGSGLNAVAPLRQRWWGWRRQRRW